MKSPHGLAALRLGVIGLGLGLAQAAAAFDLTGLERALSGPDLMVGEQALLTSDAFEQSDFMNRTLTMEGATALAGRSADTVYLAVVQGRIAAGNALARAGEVMLIPPYGGEIRVHMFDAGRLGADMGAAAQSRHPALIDALGAVAEDQAFNVFIGRYSASGFDLQAPGGAVRETRRRAAVGGTVAAEIRYSGETDGARIERLMVESVVDALAARDVGALSDLLDPLAFGGVGDDISAGARRAVAEDILSTRNWPRALRGARLEQVAPYQWVTRGPGGSATILLTPRDDFVFVEGIL